MRRFSITDKLIIASLLLSVITIMIVASYSFYNAKDAILQRAFSQLNSVRVIKSNLINKFFSNCEKEIRLAETSYDIHKIILAINTIKKDSNYTIVNKKFNKFRTPFVKELSKEYYGSIFIIGNNRHVYFVKNPENMNDTDNIDYKTIWKNSLSNKSIYIQDYTESDSITPAHITISTRITDSLDNTIGVIAFEVLSSVIDSTMLNNNPSSGLGKSGESYLVGTDYLMRSSSRFQKKSILKTKVKTEATDLILANLPGTKVLKDYRGIPVLSSYNKVLIANLNWIIIAEIDYDEVTIPIYNIRNEIIFISIFIFLIVLVVVIILSRKITYPIQKLNHAAHQVGIGNLDVKIHSNSDDEIGELTNTFNQMVTKLKAQSEEIKDEKIKSLRSMINGQETERQRLSRELHDGLGQLLIGLKLKYQSCFNKSKLIQEDFLNLDKLFDKTIEETRRISNNLMPASLSEFGLTTAIRNICNDISETTDINIKFYTKGSTKKLNLEIKIYLFRIIQEALTNIVKHSEAKSAGISLIYTANMIFIEIKDDGKGFDLLKRVSQNSNGINNIQERVTLLLGTIKIKSEEAKGTIINIDIPIKELK